MEINYTELVTNAITVECAKDTHANAHAPIYQVNTQVTHWNITSVTINGVAIVEWANNLANDRCWVNLDFSGMTYRFNTKKAATQQIIDFMVELLENSNTDNDRYAWEDEIEFYNNLVNSFKGSN